MAHEIQANDSLLLHSKPAWHGLGNIIDEDLTAVQAGRRAGMFWDVGSYDLAAYSMEAMEAMEKLNTAVRLGDIKEIQRLYAIIEAGKIGVESHRANVRVDETDGQDVKSLLGVVGADYKIAQNQELAEFTDALAQTGKVVIESVGSIRGGKRVWFLGRGEAFTIGGTDKVYPYVLVSNGHDGTSSIRVTPTTVRVVCSNTMHQVIPRLDEGQLGKAAIAIRHTGSLKDKLQAAREAMLQYGEHTARNRDMMLRMNRTEITRDQAVKMFGTSYVNEGFKVTTADELNSNDKKVSGLAKKRLDRMNAARDLFLARYDEEKAKVGNGDTVWMAFNALTGHYQHDRASAANTDEERVAKKIESNLFGLGVQRTHRALELALSLSA